MTPSMYSYARTHVIWTSRRARHGQRCFGKLLEDSERQIKLIDSYSPESGAVDLPLAASQDPRIMAKRDKGSVFRL